MTELEILRRAAKAVTQYQTEYRMKNGTLIKISSALKLPDGQKTVYGVEVTGGGANLSTKFLREENGAVAERGLSGVWAPAQKSVAKDKLGSLPPMSIYISPTEFLTF